MNLIYLRGVGIGLVIAWVTSALAYWAVSNRAGNLGVTVKNLPIALVVLEFILSIIFLALSYLL